MSKKIILVTGATGFIGNRLVRRLCESGYSVRAMVIDDDPLLSKLHGVNCEMVKGDITAPGTLRPCLEGVKTVFHLAAVLVSGNKELFHKVNYQGTENLVNAAAAYIKKTYNFSGGIDMSMWEYTRLICRTFGINKPLVGIPLWLCNFITAIIALFVKNPILNRDTILGVTMDANFNFEEATQDIGYHPADIEEGLRKVFAFKE